MGILNKVRAGLATFVSTVELPCRTHAMAEEAGEAAIEWLRGLLWFIGRRQMPTIQRLTEAEVPTIAEPKALPPTIVDPCHGLPPALPTVPSGAISAIERFNASCARDEDRAEPIGASPLAISAPAAASAFLRWAAHHDLTREWTVDEIWCLASEDFAPAAGLSLPPRRVFLGALQRQPGVMVKYDRRVYGRNGRVLAKTTIYTLPRTTQLIEWTVEVRLAA